MKQEPIALVRKERFAAWNRFWFTPADPTLLGLIRICCGAITFYTLFIYSFRLQDFMGENAWLDRDTRLMEAVHGPRETGSTLNYPRPNYLPPQNAEEEAFAREYYDAFRAYPPPPYPATREQRDFIFAFIKQFNIDPRINGLRPPENRREQAYVIEYTQKYRFPPPAYPDFTNKEDQAAIEEYINYYGKDPRMVYARGQRAWSLWFDLTDPAGMALVHGIVVLTAFLFTIGFCTRITSALTWMFSLWYIHRSPVVLFGVDTMQTILLLYLMIGPSGAALSVDRLIARWWSQNKLRIVNRWRAFWKKPALSPEEIEPAAFSPTPQPSVTANVAYRLIQIHLCIIYFVAGAAKLMGVAWWQGTAVWGTLANYEFAPMQFEMYQWMLRQLASVRWLFYLFLLVSTLFTLAFEISYAYLVWRPSTRWWLLGGAILLHGFIGLFMGLKTFSLMMLVMNMAFLNQLEVNWFLRFFRGKRRSDTPVEKTPALSEPHSDAIAATASATGPGAERTGIKVKKK